MVSSAVDVRSGPRLARLLGLELELAQYFEVGAGSGGNHGGFAARGVDVVDVLELLGACHYR